MLYAGILFSIYQVIYGFFKISNRKLDEARARNNISSKKVKRLEGILVNKKKYKSNFDKVRKRLTKLGNPLSFTPVTYYLLKFSFTLLTIVFGVLSRRNLIIVGMIAVLGYFLFDFIYWYSNRDDNKKILKDLPDIYDMLNIQTSAGVQLGVALTEVFDIPRCKRLRRDLMELSAEINLRKNPENALNNFNEKYDLLEIDNFVLAIKQSLNSGKTKEILNNQSEMLKEYNIFKIQEETGRMDARFIFIALILFIGLVGMVVYSFSIQIQGNVIKIFG